ncbi:MAG TPA: histidine kinase [Pyrinomonadaceae bacterium]
MKISLKNKPIWRIGALIIAAHAILFAVQLPQVYIYGSQNPQSGGTWIVIARLIWGCGISALITPLILSLGYYFRISSRHFRRNLFLHLLFVILTGAIQHLGYHLGLLAFNILREEGFWSSVFNVNNLFSFISTSFLRNAAVIGIQQAYFFFRESQERAFRLQQAELQMLKMQLHPHFFFNILNAISALVYRSPADAEQIITKLGDLFRAALRKDKAQEIRLKEELEFLDALLQIHQTLMGKRLTVKWEIQPEVLDALVPNLILQPLVENAIKHGIAPLEGGGQIEISAGRENESLFLRVRDNGVGLVQNEQTKNFSDGDGIGLENTRARLRNLYGDAHKFEIRGVPGSGVVVDMEIPFREHLPE